MTGLESHLGRSQVAGSQIAGLEQRDRTVRSIRMSFLVSKSSDRSMPQKLFCGSRDSMPACCSSGPSFRLHWTRNLAFLDPRCTPMMVPGCNCVRRVQFIRAPVGVMSTVCAKWMTLSTEAVTDKTIFLRGDLRLFSIGRYFTSPLGPCAEHTCYRECLAE